MAATPHVNFDYPVDPDTMMSRVAELNAVLADAGVALTVLPGAEISMPSAADLTDEELASFSIGGGRTLLVESPYLKGVGSMEELIFDLQLRGFRVLLSHPERCSTFQDDPDRLRGIVARDVYCAVNSGSLAGAFGRRVRAFAVELVRGGLVHAIASDAHDEVQRPPGLMGASGPPSRSCRDYPIRRTGTRAMRRRRWSPASSCRPARRCSSPRRPRVFAVCSAAAEQPAIRRGGVAARAPPVRRSQPASHPACRRRS